jgi:hypothetical protein
MSDIELVEKVDRYCDNVNKSYEMTTDLVSVYTNIGRVVEMLADLKAELIGTSVV